MDDNPMASRKISWLTPVQRKTVDSCDDLGKFFHENLESYKERVERLRDKKFLPETPLNDWEKIDGKIISVQRTRNKKVREIWKQPFERGAMRNDKDWYYFLQYGGAGNEYVEYDRDTWDGIKSSKLGEGWDGLVCTFDPKNVTFKRI